MGLLCIPIEGRSLRGGRGVGEGRGDEDHFYDWVGEIYDLRIE